MRQFKNITGFTILEILITIFIIAITLTSIMTVTATVINGNAFSRELTNATILAQDTLEDLKNTGYSKLTSGGPEKVGATFSRQWTVLTNSPGTGMSTIEVSVSWNRYGKPKTVKLKTIVTP
ncbi:MAG: hypothetical protein JXO48_11250 [Deltaproteobacteria bacterium]|nr:hypothetical protein [Deltaproteobacteria bacterium]